MRLFVVKKMYQHPLWVYTFFSFFPLELRPWGLRRACSRFRLFKWWIWSSKFRDQKPPKYLLEIQSHFKSWRQGEQNHNSQCQWNVTNYIHPWSWRQKAYIFVSSYFKLSVLPALFSKIQNHFKSWRQGVLNHNL